MNKRQRVLVEKQLERHHAHDAGVSLGAKVAAVAVGGVLVGVFTAGIGLVPYMTVVGVGAVVGGTSASGSIASLNWRRPSDSRLIMAFETIAEAVEWKEAIEREIDHIEKTQKPSLPSMVDPSVIWAIINKANHADKSLWRLSSEIEGLCIMEHRQTTSSSDTTNPNDTGVGDTGGVDGRVTSVQTTLGGGDYIQRSIQRGRPYHLSTAVLHLLGFPGTPSSQQSKPNSTQPMQLSICRKAQLSVNSSSPINTFLKIMNTKTWPKHGTCQLKREVNDHADIIEVEIPIHNGSWKDSGYGSCAVHKEKETAMGEAGDISGSALVSSTTPTSTLTPPPATRRITLSRFWKLDDDGIYLITLNTLPAEASGGESEKNQTKDTAGASISLDAVVTIAPRNDAANFEYELTESMITVICQASVSPSLSPTVGGWSQDEVVSFVDDFITDHLLEVRRSLVEDKFSLTADEDGLDSDQPEPSSRTNSMEVGVEGRTTSDDAGDKLSTTGTKAYAQDMFDDRINALQRLSDSTDLPNSSSTTVPTSNAAPTLQRVDDHSSSSTSGSGKDGVGSSNQVFGKTQSSPARFETPPVLHRRHTGVTKTQPGLDELLPPSPQDPLLRTGQPSPSLNLLQQQQQQMGRSSTTKDPFTGAHTERGGASKSKGKISSFFTRKGTEHSKLHVHTLSQEESGFHIDSTHSGDSSPARLYPSKGSASRDDLLHPRQDSMGPTQASDSTGMEGMGGEHEDDHRGPLHQLSQSTIGADKKHEKHIHWRRGKLDKESNSQAIFLRNQIAAKEYEMHRNVKNMRKKTVVGTCPAPALSHSISVSKDMQDTGDSRSAPALAPAASTPTLHSKFAHKYEKNQISTQELFALQWQQDELYIQSKELKSRYFSLTGESYDDVQARKKKIPFSKRRYIRNRTKSNDWTTCTGQVEGGKDTTLHRDHVRESASEGVFAAPSLVPSHWMSDSMPGMQVPRPSEYALNLSLVLVFAVCAVATSVLSLIIAQIIAVG